MDIKSTMSLQDSDLFVLSLALSVVPATFTDVNQEHGVGKHI